jgi:hypothetical protein
MHENTQLVTDRVTLPATLVGTFSTAQFAREEQLSYEICSLEVQEFG